VTAADRAFAGDDIAKKSAEFIYTRGNSKFADQFQVKSVPCLLVTDPDGEELARGGFGNERSLNQVLDAALKKYTDTPVSWESDAKAAAANKLLVVGFDDEKGEGLKALGDKTLVKYHDRCTFVRLPYEKGSETAKLWNVSSTPMLILCDPSKEDPAKQTIERLSGKKSPRELKAAIARALKKVEGVKAAAK